MINNPIKEINQYTKAFFKYANRKKKGRSTIGPLKNESGVGFERDPKKNGTNVE